MTMKESKLNLSDEVLNFSRVQYRLSMIHFPLGTSLN
jgi:hypothetical protein